MEDGNLFATLAPKVRHERHIVDSLKDAQDRAADRITVRSELDFEANLRSEIWSVHIGHALGLDPDHVEDAVQRAIRGFQAELAAGTRRHDS